MSLPFDRDAPEEAEVLAVFQKFDENNDGRISGDELKAVFQDIDPDNSVGYVDLLLEQMDVDKDGCIDYAEFLKWIMSTHGGRLTWNAFEKGGRKLHPKEFGSNVFNRIMAKRMVNLISMNGDTVFTMRDVEPHTRLHHVMDSYDKQLGGHIAFGFVFGERQLKPDVAIGDLSNQAQIDLKVVAVNLTELKNDGCTARNLRSWGHTPKQLRDAGYSIHSLKQVGYSVRELKDAGFSTRELRDANFSLLQMWSLCSTQQLREAGYTANQLVHAGLSMQGLREAGYKACDLDIYDIDGRAVKELKEAFSAQELREAGYPAEKLVKAGFAVKDIKETGYEARDLMGIEGWAVEELKEAFCAKELREAGYAADKLLNAGFSMKELKEAGYDGLEILKKALEKSRRLCNLDYQLKEFLRGAKEAGYQASELRDAGFTVHKNVGIAVQQLREVGSYTVQDFVDAGFFPQEPRKVGN